jgi:putative ATPase
MHGYASLTSGGDLFAAQEERVRERNAPLAERVRPTTLEEFVGQAHLIGAGRLLRDLVEGGKLHSVILWGPPGSGKTTLASLIARSTQANFVHFSAVLSGVKELRELIEEAREQLRFRAAHRPLRRRDPPLQQSPQDAFLPCVEDGTIVLIGATTENPSFGSSLRCSPAPQFWFTCNRWRRRPMAAIVRRAQRSERGLGNYGGDRRRALTFIAEHSWRRAWLNVLEVAARWRSAPRRQVHRPAVEGGGTGPPLRQGGRGHWRHFRLHQEHARQ